MWRRIDADGTEWEVRVVAREDRARGERTQEAGEILEFRPLDRLRSPRRVAIRAGALDEMDERALRAAYRQARPIGGDYYGRPGKNMSDTAA